MGGRAWGHTVRPAPFQTISVGTRPFAPRLRLAFLSESADCLCGDFQIPQAARTRPVPMAMRRFKTRLLHKSNLAIDCIDLDLPQRAGAVPFPPIGQVGFAQIRRNIPLFARNVVDFIVVALDASPHDRMADVAHRSGVLVIRCSVGVRVAIVVEVAQSGCRSS